MTQLQKDADSISMKRKLQVFYDEVTRQKINRHLSDINDTISDDDIRNVITDISSGTADSQKLNDYTEYGETLDR